MRGAGLMGDDNGRKTFVHIKNVELSVAEKTRQS